MMKGGPLRVVATAGAAVAAGMFTLSMASSVSLGVLSTVVEAQRVRVVHLIFFFNFLIAMNYSPIEFFSSSCARVF